MADLSSLLGSAGIGGAIGKAIVSLELETTKYQAELNAAQAQTASSANTMSTGLGKFSGLAAGAFAAVGTAAVAFAATSVQAALEANEAQLKLQNTFANNPRLADSSVAAFTRQADALRDLTGVDDEAIISSQALLGQFDLTGDQVQQLIPRIVDLSEKMGIDLETATKAVGKATQGNTGSLARYGITIDEASGKADAFGATLDGLGIAQGFAADQAKAEPWRVLGAQFEELQETVGQALIPILQGIVPVLENIIKLLAFATGATEGFDKAVQDAARTLAENELHLASWIERFSGHIPIIGEAVKVWDQYRAATDDSTEAIQAHLGLVETLSAFYRGKFDAAIDSGRTSLVRFAHMTKTELAEWSDKTKESFDTFVGGLEDITSETGITARDFQHAMRDMERDARQLDRAMTEIQGENWVNDKFIKFLSEEGPDWLIAFANSTETQQHRAQQAWKRSTEETDSAKESLDKITGVLDTLDRSDTKHHVTIVYHYEGFDPSKPGMGGMGAQP